MKRRLLTCLCCAAILALAAPAAAIPNLDGGPIEDTFWIEVIGESGQEWNVMRAGGGSGWAGHYPWEMNNHDAELANDDGRWIRYEAPPGSQQDPWGGFNPDPAWLNEWFYDHLYDPTRRKRVDVSFLIGQMQPGAPGYAEILINYTTPAYSLVDPANPPTGMEGLDPRTMPPPTNEDPDTGEQWIGRMSIHQFAVNNPEPAPWGPERFDLPLPYNPEWISIDVTGYGFLIANGLLVHECYSAIPEPTTLILLPLGALAVLRRRRR